MDRLGAGGPAGGGDRGRRVGQVDAAGAAGRCLAGATGGEVYGAALAWRQSDDLAEAGIAAADRAALSVFLERVQAGRCRLDRASVVVVDELGLLGTRQLLELLRLQQQHGFQLVAVGDDSSARRSRPGR